MTHAKRLPILYDETKDMIAGHRSDIEFIHWFHLRTTPDATAWLVPVEAEIEGQWMRGNLRIEHVGDEIDFYVGDWDALFEATPDALQRRRKDRSGLNPHFGEEQS